MPNTGCLASDYKYYVFVHSVENDVVSYTLHEAVDMNVECNLITYTVCAITDNACFSFRNTNRSLVTYIYIYKYEAVRYTVFASSVYICLCNARVSTKLAYSLKSNVRIA